MKKKAYSVYDDKACYFMPPFYCNTDAEAVRVFGMAVKDPESSLSQIPKDIVLYRIGEFDDNTGLFAPESPAPLSRGAEHLTTVVSRIGEQTVEVDTGEV